MTLIDAHHHLRDLKRNHYPWLADEPEHHFFLGEYEALKRDYMPEDYLQDSARHNVLQTVHCEAEMDRVDQVGETRWLSNINARYGFPTPSSRTPGSTPTTPRRSSQPRRAFRSCAASARSR